MPSKVSNYSGRFAGAKPIDTIVQMNYDIHSGAVLGITAKIVAFFRDSHHGNFTNYWFIEDRRPTNDLFTAHRPC